ncbi:hypothetical protein [Schaalia cardiffensis]|uniref:hypothetical protein n=1 Tax=Schaalia cardiffensis TaxID=181487 RepID=UPI001E5F2584|nr:hypothetical protein [Schaalia cardiffensis]
MRDKKRSPVVFEWKVPTRRAWKDFNCTIFSFYDTAGEDLSHGVDRAMSIGYLRATKGLILLLDPFSFPANRGRRGDVAPSGMGTDAPESVVGAVIDVLRANEGTKRGKKIVQPIAVVISKIDAFLPSLSQSNPLCAASPNVPYFDDAESKNVHDHVASLVHEWGGFWAHRSS